jgi:hypothetical protein
MPSKKTKKTVNKSDTESVKEAYQSKVMDMFREVLQGVQLANIILPESLEGENRRDFAKFCHETYHNPFFGQIIKALYLPSIEFAAKQAPDYDVVSFNRATCNGISLVEEFFLKWANVFDIEFSGKADKFDPNLPFEPSEDIKI